MFPNTRILAIFRGIRIGIFKIFSPKRCDKKQKSFIGILPEFQKSYIKKKSKNKGIQYYVKRQFSLSLIPCRFLLRHLRFSHSSHLSGTLFFIISSPGVFLFLPGSFFFRHPTGHFVFSFCHPRAATRGSKSTIWLLYLSGLPDQVRQWPRKKTKITVLQSTFSITSPS